MKSMITALMTTMMFALSPAAFAAQGPITKADVMKVLRADPVSAAALKTASSRECQSRLTKVPQAAYEMFEVTLTCTSPGDEYVGGGVYLQISIKGQYWNNGEGDVMSITMMRAG